MCTMRRKADGILDRLHRQHEYLYSLNSCLFAMPKITQKINLKINLRKKAKPTWTNMTKQLAIIIENHFAHQTINRRLGVHFTVMQIQFLVN